MDYALQVHEAKYIFPIPDGLKELSSDIIREVLRHQPAHINGFIADYLETMLIVREQARESGAVICDVFRESYFYDELYKTKHVTRAQANTYATLIEANWRGYVVRRKLSEWLKKKKKFEEEKQKKRSMRIDELLAGLGITYQEATRAAGVIQTAYKESKQGKWLSSEFGETWVGESVPFGQRIREGDRAMGRYDRWEKEDFGDFFEMDEDGAIKYIWPRVGQLQKVPLEDVTSDVEIVEFFAMRDFQGQEQYSYLIKTQSGSENMGIPIGFLVPVAKAFAGEHNPEVEFVSIENVQRMGQYTYIFKDDIDREELEKMDEMIRNTAANSGISEIQGECDFDPSWILPRVLIRTRTQYLKETDEEVRFVSLPSVVCAQENITFRAESIEQTSKIIRHLLRNNFFNVQEGLAEAANMAPYKIQETGRIFPVEDFSHPKYIQKIEIQPESNTGEEEGAQTGSFCYIFLPLNHPKLKKFQIDDAPMKIPIVRFQGYRPDFKGSSAFENKVFIMGPKINTPDGKHFTFESLFWDEYGQVSWNQLLYNITSHSKQAEKEEEGEIERDTVVETEIAGEEFTGEKDTIKAKDTERKPRPSFNRGRRESQFRPRDGNEKEKGVTRPVSITEPSEVEGEEKTETITEKEKEEKLEKELERIDDLDFDDPKIEE